MRCFSITNASGKAHTPTVARPKAPLCKGSCRVATEGLFSAIWGFLQSLRQPSAATSLYTREAFCYPYYNANRQRKLVFSLPKIMCVRRGEA